MMNANNVTIMSNGKSMANAGISFDIINVIRCGIVLVKALG